MNKRLLMIYVMRLGILIGAATIALLVPLPSGLILGIAVVVVGAILTEQALMEAFRNEQRKQPNHWRGGQDE